MDKKNLEWLANLRTNINRFIKNISDNDFSYCKYTLSGDIENQNTKWGLGNLVFLTKTLFMTDLLKGLKEGERDNLYQSILKFNDKKGYLYDPYITELKTSMKINKYFLKSINQKYKRIEDIRRAETRQSFTALFLLNKKPKKPFLQIPYTKKAVDKYLSSFNWELPWDAASHFSHLLFFLNMNSKFFNYKKNKSLELIKFACEWISSIQSAKDGCWYKGENVPLKQKINGAMKILTGLHAAEIYDFPFSKNLIDTALTAINDGEACSNFNIIYVLYACYKINPNYRKKDIEIFIKNRLDLYYQFYKHEQGGFSFNKDLTNNMYYGKKIAISKNEADIHGTTLFIWGITLINQMIDLNLDFKIPLN